jgi:hypothetical protein
MFLQQSRICLFGIMWSHLNLENPTLQEVFLSKPYSIVKRKQCAQCSYFLTQMVFVQEMFVFL